MCSSVSSSPLTRLLQKYSPLASPDAQRKAAESDPLALLKKASGQEPSDDPSSGVAEAGASTVGYKTPGTGLLVDKLA
jgi:hypothetical protein